MTNQLELQQEQSKWLLRASEVISPETQGVFTTKDALENTILLDWERIDPQSSRFNEKIKSLTEILVHTYTQVELEFAKKFPEAVSNEFFLKPIAHLFNDGVKKIDWTVIEEKIKGIFQQFFMTTDFAKYSAPNDIYLFVVAKDKITGSSLGFLQYLINQEYDYGSVKACYFGVLPAAQDRGLDKILMSSIFKLLPITTRIFLHTRSSNEKAINTYQSWGFTKFNEMMKNWPDFEYVAEHSTTLQESAKSIHALEP